MRIHHNEEIVIARHYQVNEFNDIINCIMEGEHKIAYINPTGSGKTHVVRSIASYILELMPNLKICICSPQVTINKGFIKKKNHRVIFNELNNSSEQVINSQRFRSYDFIGKNKELKNFLISENNHNHIIVSTHIGITYNSVIKNSLPEDCSNIMLIIDEAHHSDNENQLGKLEKIISERNGYIIKVTATPFRNVNGIPVSIVKDYVVIKRTMSEHQNDGYAPKNVSFIYKDVDIIGSMNDKSIFKDYDNSSFENDIERNAYYKEVVQTLLDEGIPKSILIVPQGDSERCANDLKYKISLELNIDPDRILNAVGIENKEEIIHSLTTDKNGLKYDIIIGCKRFNEGLDWPCATHLFIIGYSSNMLLFTQRIGRIMRLRNNQWDMNNNIQEKYTNIYNSNIDLQKKYRSSKEFYTMKSTIITLIPKFLENEERIDEEIGRQILTSHMICESYDTVDFFYPLISNVIRKLDNTNEKIIARKLESELLIGEQIQCELKQMIYFNLQGINENANITDIIEDIIQYAIHHYDIDEVAIRNFIVECISETHKIQGEREVYNYIKKKFPPSTIKDKFNEILKYYIAQINTKILNKEYYQNNIKRLFDDDKNIFIKRIIKSLTKKVISVSGNNFKELAELFILNEMKFGKTRKESLISLNLLPLNRRHLNENFSELREYMIIIQNKIKSNLVLQEQLRNNTVIQTNIDDYFYDLIREQNNHL